MTDEEERGFDPQQSWINFLAHASPNAMYEQLRRRVYGQDAALKQACVLVYGYLLSLVSGMRTKPLHFLIEAPSGSGKTQFAHALKALIEGTGRLPVLPVRVVDASQLTATGFRGASVGSLVQDDTLAQYSYHGIIILDEMDKLLTPQFSSHGENVSMEVQANLLKMLDGDALLCEDGRSVPCGGFLFIALGAFSDIRHPADERRRSIGFGAAYPSKTTAHKEVSRDEITAFGGSEQLLGRFSTVLHFQPPTQATFRHVAAETVRELRMLYGSHGISMADPVIDGIIREAMHSKYGCREVRNRIIEHFLTHNDYFPARKRKHGQRAC